MKQRFAAKIQSFAALILVKFICCVILLQLPATVGHAQVAHKRYDLRIDGATLAESLEDVHQQTGVQLIYPHDSAEATGVNPVNGRYSIVEALTIMLRGSGFDGRFTASGVIVISRGKSLNALRVVPAKTIVNATVDSEDGDQFLEVVYVTAQKRGKENLQRVPISISVLGGDDLDVGRFEGIAEALNEVPGVFQAPAPANGGASYSVRGVTAASANFTGASTVGYYLDEVPFSFVKTAFVADSNIYDMDRVEVLRGPQGTLYGASALNGVIRVITKSADVDKYEFKTRGGLSSTEGGDRINYRGDLAVNMPLVPGVLAARAVAGYSEVSGWIDSIVGEDLNDSQLSNARLKLRALPTENLDLEFTSWVSRADHGGHPTSGSDGIALNTFKEPRTADFDLYSVTAAYEFENFSLLSATSYMEYENTEATDIASRYILFTAYLAEFLTQEIRLASTLDGVWQWSLGGIYRNAEDTLFQTLSVVNPTPVDFTESSNSIAVFGELTRSLYAGAVEVTAGLRYFEDNTETRENTPLSGDSKQTLSVTNTKFTKATPRVVVSWYPHDDLTAYASYSEGFRSGFDQNVVVKSQAPEFPSVDPDLLRNYEIGLKGILFNGRLQYDVAAYYMDWQDVQLKINLNVNDVNLPVAINGESFSGPGVDFSVIAAPTAGLQLRFNGSWNDLGADADIISNGQALFAQGDQPNQSPEVTVGAGLDYSSPIGSGTLSGKFSASANYRSDTFSRSLRFGLPEATESDELFTSRVSFSLASTQGWTATLYIDNATNEDGKVTPNSAERFTRLRPRTIGVQLALNY